MLSDMDGLTTKTVTTTASRCRADLAESARVLLQNGRNLHPALLAAVKRDHARLRAALAKQVRRG